MKNLICFIFCMYLSSSFAFSQSGEKNRIAEAADSTSVKVTATKQGKTEVSKTPIAISALSGKQLEQSGASSTTEALQFANGISALSFDEAISNYQVRGISSNVGDPTVGYYLDEAPVAILGSPSVNEINPFDLQQIEVLRGPQGTLYGAGSIGGVIKIQTNDPDPTRFSGKADLSYGNVNDGGSSYTAQGALNIPVVEDKFAIRLVGGIQEQGGFIDNSTLNLEEINEVNLNFFRGKMLIQPNDKFTIKASYWKEKRDVGAFSSGNTKLDQPTPFEQKNEIDQNFYHLNFEYKFPNATLTGITSFLDLAYDVVDGSSGFAASDANSTQKSINQEIRLHSENEGAFNWLIGGFYNNQKVDQAIDVQFFLPDGSIFTSPFSDQRLSSDQFAAFADLSYRISDKAQISAGLRYTRDERELEDQLPSILETLSLLGIENTRNKTYTQLSPRINFSVFPTENSMIYASATNGFRSGLIQSGGNLVSGVSAGIEVPITSESENLWSYEVGYKLSSVDDKITFEAAGYYSDWSDLSVLTLDIVDIGGQPSIISYFENVDGATVVGLDWHLQYATSKGFHFSFNGNYNKSAYKKDLPGNSGIRKGDRLTNVPELTLGTGIRYAFPLAEKLDGLVLTNMQHSSARSEIANGITYKGDQISVVNARIGVQAENYGVFLYGNNLLNEDGAVFRNQTTPIDRRLRPMNYGINLKLNF